ncbi:MAG: glycosyltransferase family 39 protein [Candidatus Melainabacteria bacterium]|nr:glycosyltransferase family 39 protein [Candidatus Melainabacteria bacterium]
MIAKIKYPLLLFLIWLGAYIFCTIVLDQEIGWDEVSYLSTAKGIAENFDFSSRFNTPLGLIKYGFPQHTHHYPVYSVYLAIFFKLFGTSIQVAYFSTWLAALITCIFIYRIVLLITENNYVLSLCTSVLFLFLPRVLDYCDSAMMEIPGCALISIFTYFIFKDLAKGKVNSLLISISAIWLFLFKSLFIGAVFGLFFLIILAYSKLCKLEIKTKSSFSLAISIFFCLTNLLYFIFTKFVFLPLAPMMNFNKRQEDLGVYADFLGGFFHDPVTNLLINIKSFYGNVVLHYFPSFPVVLISDVEGFYNSSPSWCEFGLFFFFYFCLVSFLFIFWKKLLPIHKIFILYTTSSIFFFNLIFNLIADTQIGVRCRYNMVYLPLLLISIAIVLWTIRSSFLSFYREYKKGCIFLIVLFVVFVYIPFWIASLKVAVWNKALYHNIAHKNSELVKKYIGNSNPMFIQIHAGTHTAWDSFPTRVIVMDISSDEVRKINLRVPRPIEYLFIKPEHKLFMENKDLILQGKPIIDNKYYLYAFDEETKTVIYRLVS